jgi:hypothetical protein
MGMTMKAKIFLGLTVVTSSVFAGVYKVPLDTSADRVESPLAVNLSRVGTIRPRSTDEIAGSNWRLGCEVLDRDFAIFTEYRDYIKPLGIKIVRLQGGWAKCEKEKGKYDFAWLDQSVDYLRSQGVESAIETGYGNPIYEGGGGHDLGAGFPTSEEGLAGWDAWVTALANHFKGRVNIFLMWNEPDLGGKTPEMIAAFNVRTAKIIKRIIPEAKIAGLSLARNNADYLDQCLKAMGEDLNLFDWFIYHGYSPSPDSSYAVVEEQKAVLAKYNPKARLWQGENGCPSEMATRFALSRIPWSEYSQAKWDMRRMLGDLGHDVESSVFTICDFNHKGREINLKGLLRANESREVIAVKRAYYAVQNVVSVFDNTLVRVKDSTFSTPDGTLATYEYAKGEQRIFAFWVQASGYKRINPKQGKDEWQLEYTRPDDSFATRPAMFKYRGAPLKDPVWVDLLTGRVYAFPAKNQLIHSDGVTFINVPVYDSPCLLAEKGALPLM